MSDPIRADVAVIGAGAIGASSAFHLARSGLRVVVVEALEGPAGGSTGLSFASIRGQWADPLNIEMSWRSICAYRDFPATHGVDVGYRPSGYLFLVPEPAWAAQLRAVELQRAHGVPVDVLDFDAARRITPFDPDGLGGATWGPADGVVDPHLVSAAYLELARRQGTRVLYRHRVSGFESVGERWVVRAGERAVHADLVVNAAGGWAGELAALAGLSVPVVHSRRNVYSSAPGALASTLPMTVDVGSGLFLRSDGPRLLFGRARADEPDGYRIEVDWPWMETVLEGGLSRFPWLADLPLDRSGCWAGTYENTPDRHGILGADPAHPGWINACGFSGHGLMQAAEIGRLVAEQATTGAMTSLDVCALRPGRFAEAPSGHIDLVF